MLTPTDRDLHVRILAGDETALTTWQERHQPSAMRMLLHRGVPPDVAEEAWNDAFATTIRNAARLVPLGSALRRYAFKAAQRAAAHRYEESKREVATVPLIDGIQGPQQPPAAWEPLSPSARALRECIDRAPERVRVATELLLSLADARQIAAVFGIAVDSAYQVVHRTKEWLRQCVEASGVLVAKASTVKATNEERP